MDIKQVQKDLANSVVITRETIVKLADMASLMYDTLEIIGVEESSRINETVVVPTLEFVRKA